MANFIEITENNGKNFLLNLDLVVSIQPSVSQMTGSACNVFLINQSDNTPITIKLDYQKMKKLVGL